MMAVGNDDSFCCSKVYFQGEGMLVFWKEYAPGDVGTIREYRGEYEAVLEILGDIEMYEVYDSFEEAAKALDSEAMKWNRPRMAAMGLL